MKDTLNQVYKLSITYKDEEFPHEWAFNSVDEAKSLWHEESKWENTLKGVIYAAYPFRENGDFDESYIGDFA